MKQVRPVQAARLPNLAPRSLLLALAAMIALTVALFGAANAQADTLRIGYAVTPLNTLDPHQANSMTEGNFMAMPLETLVRLDAEGAPIPHLAESWSLADDDVTWTFELRQGVIFHDGTPFNAEAVKFTFERLLDPETAAPARGEFAVIEEVEVIDEHTVQIRTREPHAPFISTLAHYGSNIVSPAAVEAAADGDFGSRPVGTGAFKVERFVPGDGSIDLVRNDDYWAEVPQVSRVTVRHFPEEAGATAALLANEIDMIFRLPVTQVPVVEQVGGAEVLTAPAFTTMYLGFNTEREPFDNPEVRRALSHAVDVEAIHRDVLQDMAVMHPGPIGPSMFGFDETLSGPEYNPELARELLTEQGVEDLTIHYMVWEVGELVRMAELLQDQLARVGVTLDIDVWEWTGFISATAEGSMDMFYLTWSNSTGDADIALSSQFTCEQVGSRNRARYCSAEYDELAMSQRTEMDPEARSGAISDALHHLVDDAPWVWLGSQMWVVGVRDSIHGFEIHPSGNFYITGVEKR